MSLIKDNKFSIITNTLKQNILILYKYNSTIFLNIFNDLFIKNTNNFKYEFLKIFLYNIFVIDRELYVYESMINISPYDFIDGMNSFVGLTGTPIMSADINIPIYYDDKLGSNYELIKIITTCDYMSVDIKYNIFNGDISNIIELITYIFNTSTFNDQNIDGFIDVGY